MDGSRPQVVKKSGERGRNRNQLQTYIQQDAEQQTAPKTILVHGKQWYWQVDYGVDFISYIKSAYPQNFLDSKPF